MRIHIGRIGPALAAEPSVLEQLLERYGRRSSPLSMHKKEFGDYHFAFIDMDIDEKQFNTMRSALNGTMFRQSKLEIKAARPSYLDQLAAERSAADMVKNGISTRLNPEQVKRSRSRPVREINVYPGRNWQSKHVRQFPTFRVVIRGEVRKPKMRKRKLWGVERRPLSSLVSYFTDGEWRNSEGRAVEVVAALQDEQERDQRIAADIAANSAFLSDSDFEEFKEMARDLGEAASDDDIEVVPRSQVDDKTQVNLPESRRVSIYDSDSEDDSHMLPEKSVAQQPTTELPSSNIAEAAAEGQNTTESLRSALSAATDSPFTLFGGPAEVEAVVPQSVVSQQLAPLPIELSEPKVGLFFFHEKSPYLRSQTQAAKLAVDFDEQGWEKEFFEKRGEYNRALRKRRRDALRMARRMGKKRGE